MLSRRRRHRYRLRRLAPVGLAVIAAFVVGAWSGHRRAPAVSIDAAPAAAAVARPAQKTIVRPLRLLEGPPLLAGRLHARIAAASAILVDADTGRVLWAKRPHERRPVASTTKIMTALLALRTVGWHQVITVDRQVTRVPLVREGLRTGERVQAWKLFYSMLLYSGNDDALQLALASAGTQPAFVREMNAEAEELGMRDSHFASTSGVVDKGNWSSAWDLAALTREALRNPVFRRIVRTKRIEVPWSAPTNSKIYVNNNLMLGTYRGANGVKTGYTHAAGWCLVTSATRSGHTLVAVVLDSGDMYNDSKKLLDLGFASLG